MQKKLLLVTIFLGLTALLAACGGSEQATPTTNPAAVYTAAAQTANARLTQILAQTPSPAPVTPTPTQDIALTAAVQTVGAQLTQTAAAAVTPSPTLSPSVTVAVVSGQVDRSLYVSDVTVPDGTDFSPKQTFAKTWRIRNAGTSTWTTDYYVAFISGDKMGGPDTQRLAIKVAPGAEIDLTVNLVAPEAPGRYRGYWKMINAAGKFFDDPFYVEIDVVGGTQVVPTASVTPGGPTSTPAPTSASTTITNAKMTVDNASVTGACPQTFNFTGTFDLDTNALVTYQLEAGSSTPGIVFNLPAAQSVQLSAGPQTLAFSLNFTNSLQGWVRLRITSPVNVTSSEASFSLTCQP